MFHHHIRPSVRDLPMCQTLSLAPLYMHSFNFCDNLGRRYKNCPPYTDQEIGTGRPTTHPRPQSWHWKLAWPDPPHWSPHRLLHPAALQESQGFGGHRLASCSGPSATPAAVAAAPGPPAGGCCLVPGLVEEKAEDALPWGAGEPASRVVRGGWMPQLPSCG